MWAALSLLPRRLHQLRCPPGSGASLALTAFTLLSGGVQTFILYHRNKLATGRPGVPFVPYAEHKMAEEHGGAGQSVGPGSLVQNRYWFSRRS